MYTQLMRTHSAMLERLGLTDKETKTYLALLAQGPMVVEKIADISGLNRSTVYVQIETLTDKGLVTSFKEGKKSYFVAEPPDNIETLLENRARNIKVLKNEASAIVPELMNFFMKKGSRPSVRNFSGKQGLVTMRREMLMHTEKEIRIITSADYFYAVFTKEEQNDFTTLRNKRKIKSKVIYTMKEGEDLKPFPTQALRRADSALFEFGTEIYISDSSVSFTSIKDSVSGVLIIDKNMASMQKMLFETLWNELSDKKN